MSTIDIGYSGIGTIGPNIVLDGLVVYHDIVNQKSYPGSGNKINDISPYQGYTTASLSQVGAGYSYNSTFPQSIRFTSGSGIRASGSFTLPNFGTSFTAIVVASSPTSTWNVGGYEQDGIRGGNLVGGGTQGSPQSAFNAFNLGAYYDNNSSQQKNKLISTIMTTTSQNYYGIDLSSIDITKPHIYYLSYNNSTIISGYDNTLFSASFPLTRTPSNLTLYYSWADRPASGYESRYLNYNMYLCMIYNRALSEKELTQTYSALKSRYGIS